MLVGKKDSSGDVPVHVHYAPTEKLSTFCLYPETLWETKGGGPINLADNFKAAQYSDCGIGIVGPILY